MHETLNLKIKQSKLKQCDTIHYIQRQTAYNNQYEQRYNTTNNSKHLPAINTRFTLITRQCSSYSVYPATPPNEAGMVLERRSLLHQAEGMESIGRSICSWLLTAKRSFKKASYNGEARPIHPRSARSSQSTPPLHFPSPRQTF